MLFDKQTYTERRRLLKESIGSGIILLMGNNDSPANYPNNVYRFRQDSSFLYFFGLHREGLAGIIDVDNNREYLVGDDIDIDDIVWFGSVDSVADMAAECGVARTIADEGSVGLREEGKSQRSAHPFPAAVSSRPHDSAHGHAGHPSLSAKGGSQRGAHQGRHRPACREEPGRDSRDRACLCHRLRDAHYSHEDVPTWCYGAGDSGRISGIASSHGCMVSFPSIVTMHGEIMHGYPSPRPLEAGRLLLCDAGAETNENYCSDNTRTTPISGKFTQRQKEIYSIVEQCHDYALTLAAPGVKWWDVHFGVCRLMTDRLKELGLMKGDTEEAVRAGAHAMFMPHGLGHMMGMDVHDMEGLGQTYVGFDDEVRPNLEQFGTNCLRCGRRLQEGFVMTDEPGIYFIPALIDDWNADRTLCRVPQLRHAGDLQGLWRHPHRG